MARTPAVLGHARVSSTGNNIVIGTSGQVKVCRYIRLYNQHTAEVQVDIYFLRSGETVASDGVQIARKYLQPEKSTDVQVNVVLESNTTDILHMVASVDDVVDVNVFGTVE